VNLSKEARGRPLDEYKLPLSIKGLNYNWPAFLWRGEGKMEPVDVFEGRARARLDVTKPGDFQVGNVIQASDPNVRIGLLKWTADQCEVEAHNPTNKPVNVQIWTLEAVPKRFQCRWEMDIPAGTSVILRQDRNDAEPSPSAAP
jgi:hypothetical protein